MKKKAFFATKVPCSARPILYDESLCIGCNLPGTFKTEAEVNSTITRDTDDTKPVFKFSPSLGICWKF